MPNEKTPLICDKCEHEWKSGAKVENRQCSKCQSKDVSEVEYVDEAPPDALKSVPTTEPTGDDPDEKGVSPVEPTPKPSPAPEIPEEEKVKAKQAAADKAEKNRQKSIYDKRIEKELATPLNEDDEIRLAELEEKAKNGNNLLQPSPMEMQELGRLRRRATL